MVHHQYHWHRWKICHRFQRHGKFCHQYRSRRWYQRYRRVSTTPVVNLPLVSKHQQYRRKKFVAGVIDTGVRRCHWYWWCTMTCKYLREISNKFELPEWDTQGLGENWFMKKTWSRKSHGAVPLNVRYVVEAKLISWHNKFTLCSLLLNVREAYQREILHIEENPGPIPAYSFMLWLSLLSGKTTDPC